MNQALIDLGEHISGALPEAVEASEVVYDELMLRVAAQDVVKTTASSRSWST
jgi:hypothetical protein